MIWLNAGSCRSSRHSFQEGYQQADEIAATMYLPISAMLAFTNQPLRRQRSAVTASEKPPCFRPGAGRPFGRVERPFLTGREQRSAISSADAHVQSSRRPAKCERVP
jgi:hypothetical protein